MFVKQIAVFLENRKGRINELTKVLSDNKIDLITLSIADTNDFGILRAITNDNEKAMRVLKDAGFTATVAELIGVEVSDIPGGLHNVLKILDTEGISIEYIYSFAHTKDKRAVILFRVLEQARALEILKRNKIKVLDNLTC
ncbi:MAG: acetolactate synthase [Clostridiales bacterium]|jgi:hypothetical protein|nr:acetolactate synthase [Clostridiales bacterium]